jgi:hypothetical protein
MMPMPPTTCQEFRISRWLFLRLLALIYLAAFVSLWVQIHGLVGSQGISPVKDFLGYTHELLGKQSYYLYPTLCWIDASDSALSVLCASGTFLAVLLMLGVAQPMVLAILWTLYLSLTVAGQEFLRFQWDTLLLGTGFLAIFLAPLQIWEPGAGLDQPSRPMLWLLRWLLFRLMFGSGVVKLASGDPTWRDLSALSYHFETQPLPTWTSWYMQQFPGWMQSISVLLTFAVELIVPLMIFGPYRCRRLACLILVGFQVLILATGNYGFFNLLSIVLCVPLLDDACYPRRVWSLLIPSGDGPDTPEASGRAASPPSSPRWIPACLAIVIFLLTARPFLQQTGLTVYEPTAFAHIERAAAGLRSFNTYGLFAVMTTKRPEIVIEGSNDGADWLPYEFRWKPGDLARRPQFTTPHMPRLDWQMWFAALGDYRANSWLIRFLASILEGKPAQLALLESNPFPEKPPRYIRASVYNYHFTDWKERQKTGHWWRREFRSLYCPILSRRESQVPGL